MYCKGLWSQYTVTLLPKNEILIVVESPNKSIGLSFDGGPDMLSWGQFLASKSQFKIWDPSITFE